MSISIVGIKIPTIHNASNLYELKFDTFQLPKDVILLNVILRIDHKTQQSLNKPILNINKSACSITKTFPIAMLALAGKCEEVPEVSWNTVHSTAKV